MCSGKVPIFTDPLGRPVSSSVLEYPSSKVSKKLSSLSWPNTFNVAICSDRFLDLRLRRSRSYRITAVVS